MSVIERDLPDGGARLYHHARHFLTSATPRAIGGEPLRMSWRAVRMNDSKRQ